MPELRITAIVEVPDDAMAQGAVLADLKPGVDALAALVSKAGGALTSRVVKPTGPREKAAAPVTA
jgi:hypothetical protein